MPSAKAPAQVFDPACPLERGHSLNRGLVCCLGVWPNPGWRGGATLRDLQGRAHGALAGAPLPARLGRAHGGPGSWGTLSFDGVDDYVSLGDPAWADFGTGDWAFAVRYRPADVAVRCTT